MPELHRDGLRPARVAQADHDPGRRARGPKTDEENISDEQIESQIEVLNQDYRADQRRRGSVPGPVDEPRRRPEHPVRARTKDPTSTRNGSTDGRQDVRHRRRREVGGQRRHRRRGRPTATSTSGSATSAAACSATRSSPAARPKTDGVVILYTAFGTTGVAADPFNLGRTATHEVGHYLNLRHIWGDTNDCSGSDQVSDTPRARRPTTASPTCRTSPATTARTATCSWTTWTTSTTPRCSCSPTGQAARMNATLAGPRKKLVGG